MSNSSSNSTESLEQKRALLKGLLLKRKTRAAEESTHPLSQGQRALWFLQRMTPRGTAYNIVSSWRIRSALDIDALRQAFQSLVERHAVLRTSYPSRDGEPVSKIAERPAVAFETIEATDWSDPEVSERLQDEGYRPFDLEQGPVLKVRVLTRGQRQHVLLIVLHHIVIDGWSFEVFFEELGAAYTAAKAGQSLALPPPRKAYSDYVRWQNDLLASPQGERLWNYWRQQLTGAPQVIELPTDRPRPASRRYRGASATLSLGPSLTRQIEQVSHSAGTTPFMTLLAAFQILLYRYTGQRDLLVGSPVWGQPSRDFAGVVGYFVNVVVLRAELSGRLTFDQVLAQTRRRTLDAMAHQDYPFPLLVDRLIGSREPGRSPLVQVMFAWEQSQSSRHRELYGFLVGDEGKKVHLGDLAVETMALERPVSQHDLTLTISQVDGVLTVAAEHDTDLFDTGTIRRFLRHYRVLLDGLSTDPQQSIDAVPLLAAAAKHQLLGEWSRATADASWWREWLARTPFRPAHQIFERRAADAPDVTAAVCGDRWLSYGELDRQAERWARRLGPRDAGQRRFVAVLGDRGLEMLAVILGVAKAGAVYVPLEARHPDARLRTILDDCRPAVVVTGTRAAERGRALAQALRTPPAVLSWDESSGDALQPDGTSDALPEIRREIEAQDLANVFYTSGSTGVPKGAMVEHLGMLNHLAAKADLLGLDEDCVVVQNASAAFDISIWQYLNALLVGGRVVIYDDATTHDLTAFLATVERDRVSVLETVPSLLEPMLSEVTAGVKLDRLRYLISNAETLPVPLARSWHQRFPAVPLINTYGATECSDDVTHQVFRSRLDQQTARVGVGEPIAGMNVYVLDRHLQPVPAGCHGQIAFTGIGVGAGYLGDAAKTARTFVPDPWGSGRLYLTGDLGRWTASGKLDFLRRLDDQVKLHGRRIEPGEVTATLVRHPQVSQAAVVVRASPEGRDRLVAYVVGDGLDRDALVSFLRRHLPVYMVPEAFVELQALPLNANGKVDRKALPDPAPTGPDRDYTPPGSELEKQLAAIWRDLLGVERVGIHDDYFELGGNSLISIQLISRLKRQLDLELRLEQLFAHPTVAEVAAVLARTPAAASGGPSGEITRLPDQPHYPLSSTQLWLFFQYQVTAENMELPETLRLRGSLDLVAWRAALQDLVQRHEVLRTRFDESDGEPVQIICSAPELSCPVHDFSDVEPLEQRRRLRDILETEVLQPFDLTRPPLFRACLVKLAAEEHLSFLNVPHVISDGRTEELLLSDLAHLYNAYRRGHQPSLSSLPLRYVDFADWQLQQLGTPHNREQREFWLERFASPVPDLDLPRIDTRSSDERSRSDICLVNLDEELTGKLRQLSAAHGATLFMTLLSAFQVVLSRWTGQTDVVVGTVVSGRRQVELKDIAGPFVNPLALRTPLAGDRPFVDLLRRAKETTLAALDHQDYPFHAWVDEVRRRQQDSGWLPCSVWFFLFTPRPTPTLEELAAEERSYRQVVAEIDLQVASQAEKEVRLAGQTLTVDATETARGVEISAVDSSGRLGGETLDRLLLELRSVLAQVAEAPDRRISEIDLVSDQERRRLLGWGRGEGWLLEQPSLLPLLEVWNESTHPVVALDRHGKVSSAGADEGSDPYLLARFVARHEAVALVAPVKTLRRLDQVLHRVVEPQWLAPLDVVGVVGTGSEDLHLENLRHRSLSTFLPLTHESGLAGGLWQEPETELPERVLFVGRPAPGRSLHILDAWRQPVAPGRKGAIYLEAPGDSQDFVDNLSPTGFVGRWRADGGVEVLEAPAPPAPRTASRRSDRLPSRSYTAPRTSLENRLCAVWQRVLGLDSVGVDDDFFDLGGTAEDALEISERLAAVDLLATPGAILKHATIAALAPAIETATESADGVEGGRALSPWQRAVLSQTLTDARSGCLTLSFQTTRRLDRGTLERAIEELSSRHEALASELQREGGLWLLRRSGPRAALLTADLSALPADRFDAAWERLLEQTEQSPPALSERRLQVVHGIGSGERQTLALVASQLFLDEQSLVLIARDLAAIYRALERQTVAEEPPRAASFHAWLAAAERLDGYREAGAEAPDPRRAPAATATYHRLVFSLTGAPDSTEVPVPELASGLVSALAQALADDTASSRIVIGVEVDARQIGPAETSLDATVGQLAARRPLLLPFDLDSPAEQRLREARQRLEAAAGEPPSDRAPAALLRWIAGHGLLDGEPLRFASRLPKTWRVTVPGRPPEIRVVVTTAGTDVHLQIGYLASRRSEASARALAGRFEEALREQWASSRDTLTSRVLFGLDAQDLESELFDETPQEWPR